LPGNWVRFDRRPDVGELAKIVMPVVMSSDVDSAQPSGWLQEPLYSIIRQAN
jgi:hypothetical protein